MSICEEVWASRRAAEAAQAERERKIEEIRSNLEFGYNLNAEQGRFLWQLAFGWSIGQRKRCPACGAIGCEVCGGSGYESEDGR